MDDQNKIVSDYYGNVLSSKEDLKTSACCLADSMPKRLRSILELIHPEVQEKFYGCGSPIPNALEGLRVLDLGCGTGQDCYIISKLVGESGKVVGVDMTDEQLEVARKHIDYHTKEFGFKKANVEFVKGNIQDLKECGFADNSFDLVISNCVLNLASDKKIVFEEIERVLAPNGELYFSDVFTDRRVPTKYYKDQVLLGECLSGALYIEDFRRFVREIFDSEIYTVSKSIIELHDEHIVSKVGDITFYSITERIFNLKLEDAEEDYGETATYLGGLDEDDFIFSDDYKFSLNKEEKVSGNIATILKNSRYKKYFKISGNKDKHLGLLKAKKGIKNIVATSSCC